MSRISKGFVFAGLVNFAAVLFFSQGFTNDYLGELYPGLASTFGMIAIMLWGAAYIAVAKSYWQVPALVGVFAVEKFVYFGSWVLWLADPPAPLGEIFERSMVTGGFYASYGPVDGAFGLFFAWVLLKLKRDAQSS